LPDCANPPGALTYAQDAGRYSVGVVDRFSAGTVLVAAARLGRIRRRIACPGSMGMGQTD
jgi:hypothetical protein